MAITDLISQAKKSRLGKAISNVVSSVDRDKEQEGFQFTAPNSFTRRGVQRVQQSFREDPGRYSLTRGFSNVVPATQIALSPINYLQGKAPSQFAQDVAYGLRGATQLTPFQAVNYLGIDKKGQEQFNSTAPTTDRQKTAQQIGRSTYGLALTAPLGGANLARNVAGRAIGGVGAGAGLGAGISALTGGDVSQGARQGALSGYSFAPLGAITNPLTEKALRGVPVALQGQVGQRAIGGIANLIEDELQGFIDGYDTDTRSRITSLAIGAVLTGNDQAIDNARQQLRSLGVNNADQIIQKTQSVAKTQNAQPRNSLGQWARASQINTGTDDFRRMSDIWAKSGGSVANMTSTQRNNFDNLLYKLSDNDVTTYNKNLSALQGISQQRGPIAGQTITNVFGQEIPMPPSGQAGFIDFSGEGLTPNIQASQPTKGADTNFDPQRYIKEQVKRQELQVETTPYRQKIKEFTRGIRSRVEDFTFPIEDALNTAEKKYKFNVLPKSDVRMQIDNAIRSDTLATQFIKDNGVDRVIREVDDLDSFNQYLIAKQAIDVSAQGKETGRDVAKDRALIDSLSGRYEAYSQQIIEHNRKLLDYAVDSGLVSKDLADTLKQKYPNYVPLNRVFEEVSTQGVGSKAVASVSTNNVIKKLEGSKRAVVDPLESIMANTGETFALGERNRAAQMIASYKDIPGNPFGLREFKPGEKIGNKPTISVYENGQKKTFEVYPEIAEAAKNLSKEQLNIYGKLLAVPTRLLKIGATGLNLPFIATNLVRDQFFSSVVSSKGMQTSFLNVPNFIKALYESVNRGKLYDDWVRSGASFTSFDIARNQAKPGVARIRSSRSVSDKAAYIVKNPMELVRAVEDLIGRTEELTRMQNFEGMRQALIKEGRTPADANLLAAKASRDNSSNFGRSGSWGTVLNGMIPYFNAGIQGARSLRGAFARDPKRASAQFMMWIGTPIATATLWNISDPDRKAAYDDIQDFEKENNIIIIPPRPERDENGRWKVIKIPVTPGLSHLANMVRRPIESISGSNTADAWDVATDLITATTSLDISSKEKVLSTFTPQLIKPGVEMVTNKNLFTGQDIVPSHMKDLPAEMQVKDNTSGTARYIGGATGISPIMVESLISTTTGGLGRQLLNQSDKLLLKAGKITEEQVGGESAIDNTIRRFTLASGGVEANKIYQEITDKKVASQIRNNDIKLAYLSNNQDVFNQLTEGMEKGDVTRILNNIDTKEQRKDLTPTQKALQSMGKQQRMDFVANNPKYQDDLRVVEGMSGTPQEGIDSSGIVYYQNNEGNWTSLDYGSVLSMPESTRFEKAKKEKEAFSMLSKALESNIPQEKIAMLTTQLRIPKEDVLYFQIAKENNDMKELYVMDSMERISRETGDRQKFIEFLVENRKEVNGEIVAADGVLSSLRKQGYITKAEENMLKRLDFSTGKPVLKPGKGTTDSKKDPYAAALKKYLDNLAKISLPSGKIRTQAPVRINTRGLTFEG